MEGKPTLLNNRQIHELDSIGFVWDSHGSAWESKFAMLVKFRNEHGHCRVPRDYPENTTLTNWVKRQRRFYKAGTMCPSRIARMEELGFVWDPRGIHDALGKQSQSRSLNF